MTGNEQMKRGQCYHLCYECSLTPVYPLKILTANRFVLIMVLIYCLQTNIKSSTMETA